jgi:tetratricopeptide (TPR) repeat protein
MRLLLLTAVLAISTPAAADSKADYLARANTAFAAGHYQEALDALDKAYAIDPDPEVVFALGQVHMKLGDCKQALAYYQSFLATKPDARETAIATKAIERCKSMTPEPEPPKPPTPAPVEPVAPPPIASPPPPPPPPEHIAWYRDVLGDALVIGGLAAGAVGAIEYRSAVSHRDDADSAPAYRAYVDDIDAAHRAQNLAIGFAAGAGVLVVAGIVRYATRDDTRERTTTVLVVPTPNGTFATWSARF